MILFLFLSLSLSLCINVLVCVWSDCVCVRLCIAYRLGSLVLQITVILWTDVFLKKVQICSQYRHCYSEEAADEL